MDKKIREIYYSDEYKEYLDALPMSFIESSRVIFLNSFLKKSKKQYKQEVEIANKILRKYMEE